MGMQYPVFKVGFFIVFCYKFDRGLSEGPYQGPYQASGYSFYGCKLRRRIQGPPVTIRFE